MGFERSLQPTGDGDPFVRVIGWFQHQGCEPCSRPISKAGILKLLSVAVVSMRRQPLTPVQVSEAAELYRSGLSLAKASAQLVLPHESIRRALVSAGVEMRPHGPVLG